jgi:short-subunit dehydrogenase
MISKVRKLDIGILVNNVGTSDIKEYENFSYDEIKKIINVNCTSMSLMTS